MTLPFLTSTEEAEAYGREMTPDQYLRLEGAREALQREFNALPTSNYDCLDYKSRLATKIQLFGETLECAPFATLAVLQTRK